MPFAVPSSMVPRLQRWVLAVLACAWLALANGCASSSSDDPAGDTSASAVSGQVHIAPGIELARQNEKQGSAIDKQRASVHFGNAYWLAQFSFISYAQEDAIRSTLTRWGFDGRNTRFFVNTCNGALAYYVPANGFGVLVFRGTLSWGDWALDFKSPKIPWEGAGLVHWGFHDRLLSLWNADASCGVNEGLASFLVSRASTGGALYLTGHSLGAALATLALAYTQAPGSHIPVSALYTYGSPRVGNEDFAYATGAGARGRTAIFRFVNGNDIVTGVPQDLDPIEALYSDFRHVGLTGESESVFEVWVKDRQLEVSQEDTHTKYVFDDHLGYVAPLGFQANVHNQMH